MRVIIEVEGQGSGTPEVVLRSASTGAATTSVGATSLAGAIDAGAAPTSEGTALTQGMVTTPATSASFDPASAQSAGAAPAPTTAG